MSAHLLNGIQLLQGDCLELMKDIPDGSVDMILCDLPYGTTRNAWDSIVPLEPLWDQYRRIIKENGCIALFAQCPFDKVLGCSNLKMLRYEWVWDKRRPTGFLNSRKMPMKQHENVLIFYKKLPTYNPQLTKGKPYITRKKSKSTNYNSFNTQYETVNDGWRFPIDIQACPPQTWSHPTQKPVSLLEYLVKTYTNPGEVVLDNCMGSGSTGVACVNTGRRFIGMELDQGYFDIAVKRIAEATKTQEE